MAQDSELETSEFMEDGELEDASNSSPSVKDPQLTLTLSLTLIRKLQDKAMQEGVSANDLACELLAEGLVLRAWEIVEKKHALRGRPMPTSNGPMPHHNKNGNNGGRGGQHNNQRPNNGPRRPNNFSYNNPSHTNRNKQQRDILEDSANFIEYVRSQEKKERY
jgi:hypothetical protein